MEAEGHVGDFLSFFEGVASGQDRSNFRGTLWLLARLGLGRLDFAACLASLRPHKHRRRPLYYSRPAGGHFGINSGHTYANNANFISCSAAVLHEGDHGPGLAKVEG